MNQAINDSLAGVNSIGRAFCSHAAGAFVQSAFLVVLLFVLDLLLRRRVRAVFRYCIWLLVLVKLVLPPTLSLPTGIGYWVPDHPPIASDLWTPVSDTIGYEPARPHRYADSEPSPAIPEVQPSANAPQIDAPVPPAASNLTPISWQGVVFLLWLVGVFAFALLLAQRLRFVKGLVVASTPAGGELLGLLEQCRAEMGVHRPVGLRTLDTVPSPAVCGLRYPIILMPASLVERLSPEGLRAALIHELAHIKRADLWINAVQTLLQVIYFYNPFVWFANVIIRRTCEEAVDETVLVALGGQAKSYSNTLIDIGEMAFWKADFGLRLVGVAESRKALQGRIKHMLTRPVPKSTRIGALGSIAILIVAAVLLPMARAERSNRPEIPVSTRSDAGQRIGDRDTPVVTQAASVGAAEKVPAAAESNIFVDPQTGIRFTKFKTISGASDVIEYSVGLTLSSNGKFLLSGVRVIPLGGDRPFDLVDMPNAARGSWSPDGKTVVFYCGAMWRIDVDLETGRPTGTAKKLLDGDYWHQYPVLWSSDSRKIIFAPRDSQGRSGIWTLFIETGEQSQVTDPFSLGLVSPDGTMIACSDCQGMRGEMPQSCLRVKPVAGGDARKISDLGYPVVWSAGGRWLVCDPGEGKGFWKDEIRFVRVTDGREVKVKAPGCWVRQSLYGKKLLFYRGSYDYGAAVLKVVSVAGGPPADLGLLNGLHVRRWGGHSWTRDARSILVEGEQKGSPWNLYAVPLDGKDLRPLSVDTPLFRQADFRVFSPDGSKLLLGVKEKGRPYDLWVVPVSLGQMKTTGPAVKIFGGMVQSVILGGESWAFLDAWSPDSRRIAFSHQGDIWVISADGQNPVQLTEGPEQDLWPDWSPDSRMIAVRSIDVSDTSHPKATIRVVPASGGEPKVISEGGSGIRSSAWSADGKNLTIVSESGGAVSNIPISGGDARTLLSLRDRGIDGVEMLRWSPDGRFLAFHGGIGRSDQKLYVYQPDTTKLERFDMDEETRFWYWSPDSKWISFSEQPIVKLRPEGVLWEMDVEDALAKLPK